MTMWHVYLVCAAIGGTVMVCQFLLTVFGLVEADHGGDVGGHDFDAGHDVGGDHDFDADHPDHVDDQHVSSSWLFGVITFRTVVTALAFFGLAGLAARSAELTQPVTLAIALASGVAAMYFVHWMMQGLYRLREDGTARIGSAVGQTASVYLRIPGGKDGAGKVTVSVQGREMQYQAMTRYGALPTGARVVVTGVVDRNTVEVEPTEDAEQAEV